MARKAFAATAAAIVLCGLFAVEILIVVVIQRLIEHDGRYSLVFAGTLALIAVGLPFVYLRVARHL